jgi:penicillin amidase
MTAIQLDSRSGIATDLAPALTRLTLTGPAAKAQEVLAAWDLTQPVDSAGAALFNATWRHLLADTFNDDLPAAARSSVDGGERWFTIVGGLLNQPDSPWWDDRGTAATETRDDILARAVREATTELTEAQGSDPSGWRWGRMHTLTVANQSLGLSGIPPLEWLFNRGPYAVGGGAGLVAATGWSAPEGYAVNWVPSMRLVVDLRDLDASRWINLTGASGHAFDRHYADQAPLWAAGKTVAMPFSAAAVRSTARHSLALRP